MGAFWREGSGRSPLALDGSGTHTATEACQVSSAVEVGETLSTRGKFVIGEEGPARRRRSIVIPHRGPGTRRRKDQYSPDPMLPVADYRRASRTYADSAVMERWLWLAE